MSLDQPRIEDKAYCSSCGQVRPSVVSQSNQRPICHHCLLNQLAILENTYTKMLVLRAALEVHLGK